jgi:hypothetical protein
VHVPTDDERHRDPGGAYPGLDELTANLNYEAIMGGMTDIASIVLFATDTEATATFIARSTWI